MGSKTIKDKAYEKKKKKKRGRKPLTIKIEEEEIGVGDIVAVKPEQETDQGELWFGKIEKVLSGTGILLDLVIFASHSSFLFHFSFSPLYPLLFFLLQTAITNPNYNYGTNENAYF